MFQKCRAVDAEGPLARLKNLLFSQDTLETVEEWITVSYNLTIRNNTYAFNFNG